MEITATAAAAAIFIAHCCLGMCSFIAVLIDRTLAI
jgi:hypothetical protein